MKTMQNPTLNEAINYRGRLEAHEAFQTIVMLWFEEKDSILWRHAKDLYLNYRVWEAK